jgi:NAD-dependent deacetylase
MIDLSNYKNIVILTGAGVSVASGLKTFRGAGGLWNDEEVYELSYVETLQEDPHAVWKFWVTMRNVIQKNQPNPAHLALAQAELQLRPDQNFLLITQNVDGFHIQAGSKNVAELHGNVLRTRCSNPKCTLQPYLDTEAVPEELPHCPICGAYLRVDIVLFGEQIPVDAIWRVKKALRDCDLFLAIGTSGTVEPAASFVRGAEYAGARTVYINMEPMEPPNSYFKESILGKAEEILPTLIKP